MAFVPAETLFKTPAQQTTPSASGTSAPSEIDPSTVSYTPHKWGLKFVSSVLIPTKFATEAGLIAVARRIDLDAPDYQSVDIEIFDDAKAEKLAEVDEWSTSRDLTKAERALLKAHELASYRRNRGMNINELSLYDFKSTGKVIKGEVTKEIRLTEGEPLGGMAGNAIEERRKRGPDANLIWDGTVVKPAGRK